MIITTEHGTKFLIDTVAKTWARIDKTGESGNLRDESGVYDLMVNAEVGKQLRLFCPPRVPGAYARLVQTSTIALIEE